MSTAGPAAATIVLEGTAADVGKATAVAGAAIVATERVAGVVMAVVAFTGTFLPRGSMRAAGIAFG